RHSYFAKSYRSKCKMTTKKIVKIGRFPRKNASSFVVLLSEAVYADSSNFDEAQSVDCGIYRVRYGGRAAVVVFVSLRFHPSNINHARDFSRRGRGRLACHEPVWYGYIASEAAQRRDSFDNDYRVLGARRLLHV